MSEINHWRSLLSQTGWSKDHRRVESIAFTGCGIGHGVTTVAANIAGYTAECGPEVLVIDVNMQHPQLHEVFGVPQAPGLLELHNCGESQVNCLHATSRPNLKVLPTGNVASSDLSDLEDAGELLKSLAADFDLMVLDVPAVSVQPFTANWMALMDCVVLVVSHNKTSSIEAAKATAELRRAGVELSGVVINKRMC